MKTDGLKIQNEFSLIHLSPENHIMVDSSSFENVSFFFSFHEINNEKQREVERERVKITRSFTIFGLLIT